MCVFSDMQWSNSLMIDKPSGEQVVRRPRCTDAIGTSLREGFGTGPSIPEDMLLLLGKLDGACRRR
jgi:hypothetical protein